MLNKTAVMSYFKKKLVMERIQLIGGDITKIDVDAVVNAANASLLGGGGVDGAIHKAGGPEILEECKQIRDQQGKCPPGEAVITTAGELPAKKVIHAVGPVWGDQPKEKSDQLLANCYRNSLQLAMEHDLKTVAFPNISTGVYGFPKERAAEIAVQEVRDFLSDSDGIEGVSFVCFDDENFRIYKKLLSD